jgi:hypothetical protein
MVRVQRHAKHSHRPRVHVSWGNLSIVGVFDSGAALSRQFSQSHVTRTQMLRRPRSSAIQESNNRVEKRNLFLSTLRRPSLPCRKTGRTDLETAAKRS